MLFTIERYVIRASARFLQRCFSNSVDVSAREFVLQPNESPTSICAGAQKSLKIAFLGVPNLIFLDTPGMVSTKESKKFKLASSFKTDPKTSLQAADIVGIVQDAENVYTRHKIDTNILELLTDDIRSKIPIILVINKVDRLKKKEILLDLIHTLTKSKKSPDFYDIFMISALTGDGINDLRTYLLDTAKSRAWEYEGHVYSDNTCEDVIRQTVRAKLMDILPNEVPYRLQVKLEHFDPAPDDSIKALVSVTCPNKRIARLLTRGSNNRIGQTAVIAEEALRHAFRTSVRLKISVQSPSSFFTKISSTKENSNQDNLESHNSSDKQENQDAVENGKRKRDSSNSSSSSSPSKKQNIKLKKPKTITKTPSPGVKPRAKLGATPKNKLNKLSPGSSKKTEKKQKGTPGGKKKKKEEDETVNGTVEEKTTNTVEEKTNNAQIGNGAAEGKRKTEESASSKKESESNTADKVKKTEKVKKKRARIIEPVDSSDDEDHLSLPESPKRSEVNDEEKKIESEDKPSEINNVSNNDTDKSASDSEEKSETPKKSSTPEKSQTTTTKDESPKKEPTPEKKAKKCPNKRATQRMTKRAIEKASASHTILAHLPIIR
ncbi:Uncharacterized protein DBV15_05916 [Temnothorax longispinosus]|uniref:Tr-type G domain-containing protein n=1 Tax=Temnothorax longispinosus TaxID=300112 RepID=A0A4V3SAI4_9HYME|nr:Uncharacterized protein DBV15_05916 [Temnothorax longispinosus]